MKYIIVLMTLSLQIFANSSISQRKNCLNIKKFTKNKYKAECFYNYHHYSPNNGQSYNKYKAISEKNIKIANFNVYHPGNDKTRFKDFKRVAAIMNKWDLIAAEELIPIMANNKKHNEKLLKYIKETKVLIRKMENEFNDLSNPSTQKYKLLQFKIKQYKAELKKAPSIYRVPGYIKILNALKKLDPSWGLVLSPRGEAAEKTHVHELVGFYYRGSIVKPITSQYCKDIRTHNNGDPVACIPNMGARLLGISKRNVFSRRPFLAQFRSGRFSFVAIANHIRYNSPTSNADMKYILNRSFGVNSYHDLPKGVTKDNYARFAELKITLEFMQKIKDKYREKDIILMGDFNLESSNPFMSEVINTFERSEIFVDNKTSLSFPYYDKNMNKTLGLASNFDHFILNPRVTSECDAQRAKVFNFFNDRYLNRDYIIRSKYINSRGAFSKDRNKYKKAVEKFVTPYRTGKQSFLTISSKKIPFLDKLVSIKGVTPDQKKNDDIINKFIPRVLDSQLNLRSHYKVHAQVISDHLPIYMSCRVD